MVTHRSDAAFLALADPTRRALLDLLRRGPWPAGEIARRFPVSRPAISRHLRRLRRAKLVCQQRRGRQRLYLLNPQPLRQVDRWLGHYRFYWSGKLAQLKTFLESPPRSETEPDRKSAKRKSPRRKS